MAELLFQTGDELRRNRGRNLFRSALDVMATSWHRLQGKGVAIGFGLEAILGEGPGDAGDVPGFRILFNFLILQNQFPLLFLKEQLVP